MPYDRAKQSAQSVMSVPPRYGEAMKRREFITLLGGAAAAWPLAARAQPGKVWRIGILGASLNVPNQAAQYQAFLAELKALGFEEGKNLSIRYGRVDDPRGP